jgi:hypothetical protein
VALTRAERERVSDSRLKLQSAADSLSNVDPQEIPNFEDIQECLENADKSLSGALRPDPPKPKRQE